MDERGTIAAANTPAIEPPALEASPTLDHDAAAGSEIAEPDQEQ